jgi:iron complex outermembrane recepter protein
MKQNSLRGGMKFYATFILVLLSLLTSTCLLYAQNDASITGSVLDPSGNVVSNAVVTITGETNGHRKATADAQGHFAVTGLSDGKYTVEATASGFAITIQNNLVLTPGQTRNITLALSVGEISQIVTVEASASNSLAAQHALSQASLDTESAQSFIGSEFIRNFAPATTDFSELINIAPGTISYNPNGVGLGQGTMYFRGFVDGDYNITWNGIPFNDSNNPTHHSWSFFPGPWIGGVNFDRSPGTASTIGQATFGGSINLLSPEVPSEPVHPAPGFVRII